LDKKFLKILNEVVVARAKVKPDLDGDLGLVN